MYALYATAIFLAFVLDPAIGAENDPILNGRLMTAGASMCLTPAGTGVTDSTVADACAELTLLEGPSSGQYRIVLASDTTMQLTLAGDAANSLTASGTPLIFSDGSTSIAAVTADDVSTLTANTGNVLLAATDDADPNTVCLLVADASYTAGSCTTASDKWYFVITCENDEALHPDTSVCTACSTISDCSACSYSGSTLQCTTCSSDGRTPSNDETACAYECADSVDNCAECLSAAATCSDCDSGYYLDTTCQSCSIENCDDCSDASTCTECADGYGVADDDSCEECTVENCATCATDSAACDTCGDGYRRDSATTCTECDVDNCESCPDDVATCTECNDGYSLSDNTCNADPTTTQSGSNRVGLSFFLLLGAAIISCLMM